LLSPVASFLSVHFKRTENLMPIFPLPSELIGLVTGRRIVTFPEAECVSPAEAMMEPPLFRLLPHVIVAAFLSLLPSYGTDKCEIRL
jgi:hypothetical protein